LRSAWERASEEQAQNPPWSADHIRTRVATQVAAVRGIVEDLENGLTYNERAVLAYAASRAEHHGMVHVALPRRPMLEATSLGLTALRTALRRLHEKGLLTCVESGRPNGPNSRREARAALYSLPDPSHLHIPYRETRPVVPSAHTCGALGNVPAGALPSTCGAPSIEEEPNMSTAAVSLTLTAPDPTVLAEALAVLTHAGVRVQHDQPPEKKEPVIEGDELSARRRRSA